MPTITELGTQDAASLYYQRWLRSDTPLCGGDSETGSETPTPVFERVQQAHALAFQSVQRGALGTEQRGRVTDSTLTDYVHAFAVRTLELWQQHGQVLVVALLLALVHSSQASAHHEGRPLLSLAQLVALDASGDLDVRRAQLDTRAPAPPTRPFVCLASWYHEDNGYMLQATVELSRMPKGRVLVEAFGENGAQLASVPVQFGAVYYPTRVEIAPAYVMLEEGATPGELITVWVTVNGHVFETALTVAENGDGLTVAGDCNGYDD